MTERIIVTGAQGMLGRAVVEAAHARNLDVSALSKDAMDITDSDQVQAVLHRYRSPLVINCAGIVPGRSDVSTGRMIAVNTSGPYILAHCAKRLVNVSTDCVFDGLTFDVPYIEGSMGPHRDAYGRSKLEGEVRHAPHLTVRGSFVGFGERGLLRWLLDHAEGSTVPGYPMWLWNGSYVATFAEHLLDLALDEELTGVVHLAGPQVMSKFDLLTMVAARLRPDLQVIQKQEPPRMMLLGSTRIEPITTPWTEGMEQMERDYSRDTGRA